LLQKRGNFRKQNNKKLIENKTSSQQNQSLNALEGANNRNLFFSEIFRIAKQVKQ
jgi:hypothetical protein